MIDTVVVLTIGLAVSVIRGAVGRVVITVNLIIIPGAAVGSSQPARNPFSPSSGPGSGRRGF